MQQSLETSIVQTIPALGPMARMSSDVSCIEKRRNNAVAHLGLGTSMKKLVEHCFYTTAGVSAAKSTTTIFKIRHNHQELGSEFYVVYMFPWFSSWPFWFSSGPEVVFIWFRSGFHLVPKWFHHVRSGFHMVPKWFHHVRSGFHMVPNWFHHPKWFSSGFEVVFIWFRSGFI